METATYEKPKTATIEEYAAMKGVDPDQVKTWAQHQQVTTLHQDDRVLIDVDASENQQQQAEEDTPTIETLMQHALAQAQASANFIIRSRSRWQLAAFTLMAALAISLIANIVMGFRTTGLGFKNEQLFMDNYQLTEQLETVKADIGQLNARTDILRTMNTQLAKENAVYKADQKKLLAKLQTSQQTPASATDRQTGDEPRFTRTAEQSAGAPRTGFRMARIEAIRSGRYPSDMRKSELIAALGQPDRSYANDLYEQVVYFGRNPGRFWFKKSLFVDVAQ